MQVEVLGPPKQPRAIRHQRDVAQEVDPEVVEHAVVVADLERRPPPGAREVLALVGGHDDLPPVRGAARDGCLVVLGHVARMWQRACQVAYNYLGSGVSLDITHAFPIASTLALRALGAPAT